MKSLIDRNFGLLVIKCRILANGGEVCGVGVAMLSTSHVIKPLQLVVVLEVHLVVTERSFLLRRFQSFKEEVPIVTTLLGDNRGLAHAWPLGVKRRKLLGYIGTAGDEDLASQIIS